MFQRPWTVVGRAGILLKTLHRIVRSRSLNPIRWCMIAGVNLHKFLWVSTSPAQPRTYLAGTEVLDPQYREYPADITQEDRIRYFEPVAVTDAEGRATGWLKPYVPGVRPTSSHPPVAADLRVA